MKPLNRGYTIFNLIQNYSEERERCIAIRKLRKPAIPEYTPPPSYNSSVPASTPKQSTAGLKERHEGLAVSAGSGAVCGAVFCLTNPIGWTALGVAGAITAISGLYIMQWVEQSSKGSCSSMYYA
jgi:hypothetical protein